MCTEVRSPGEGGPKVITLLDFIAFPASYLCLNWIVINRQLGGGSHAGYIQLLNIHSRTRMLYGVKISLIGARHVDDLNCKWLKNLSPGIDSIIEERLEALVIQFWNGTQNTCLIIGFQMSN